MKRMFIELTIFFVLVIGCTQIMKKSEEKKESPKISDKISWEKYPENKNWSDFVYGLINNELFELYDSAGDAEVFCPKYKSLSKEQKVFMWTELISAISYYESAWNPVSRMTETTMGEDCVTNRQVVSEGLMQMSYCDTTWAPFCKFDWNLDKQLSAKDPKKTILDPLVNLNCGVRVLANQVKKRGFIILSNNVYWAVIKRGGKYQQIDNITAMTKKLSFCK
jgi:hypothetical protein